jgi:hypothetical protein
LSSFTLKGVPWAPGTSVGAYPRRSEVLPDTGAPGTALETRAVAADASLTYTTLPDGEYWAAAAISATWRYVAFNVKTARGSVLPGAYCQLPSAPLTPSALAVVANQGRIIRFEVARDMLVTQLAFAVTVGASVDDAVDVGIYSAAGARLVSSGSTPGKLNGAAGRRTVPITPTTLRAGQFYYFALAVGAIGGTAASLMGLSPNALAAGQLFGAAIGLVETDAAGAVFPLPATWTIGAASSTAFLGAVLE